MRTLPLLLLLFLIGCQKEVFKPTVKTTIAEQITLNSAIVGGEVTSIGSTPITDRGVYWGTLPNTLEAGIKLSIGIGSGTFSNTLEGLIQNTTYYYQAFALNLQGASYGEVVSFSTLSNIFKDSRDSQEYKWVQIGQQFWMSENLKFLPAVSPPEYESDTMPMYYVYSYEGAIVSEAKSNSNHLIYGVLYNFEAAKTACPSGWHLPTDEEWTVLTDYLGSDAGNKMKATSGWNSNGNGDNSSGFTGLPGGYRNYGGFHSLGNFATFWSASEIEELNAWLRDLNYSNNLVFRSSNTHSHGLSVRCIRD